MKNFIKVGMSFILVTFLLNAINTDVLRADSLQTLYDDLAQLEAKANANEEEKQKAQDNIDANTASLNQANADIIAKQDDIKQNENDIADLEVEKEIKDEEIRELLSYYQKNTAENMQLELIVNSDSIVDAINRSGAVDKLTGKSDEKIEEFIGIQESLRVMNEQLKTDIGELEDLKVIFKETIAKLNIDIADLDDEKVDIKDQINDAKELIAYYEDMGCERNEDLEQCKIRTGQTIPPASGFYAPVEDGYITAWSGWYSPFGYPMYHTGTDMAGGSKTILASAAGTVAAVAYDGVRGHCVYIHHTVNGVNYTTYYGHLAYRSGLQIGQSVDENTVIGTMGTTGSSTGVHLHFEIQQGWYGIDFWSHASAALDVRNFMSFPAIRVYWSGRSR